MLVSAKEMLEKARDGHYAVGQFNINNLEWTKSILQTAHRRGAPLACYFGRERGRRQVHDRLQDRGRHGKRYA